MPDAYLNDSDGDSDEHLIRSIANITLIYASSFTLHLIQLCQHSLTTYYPHLSIADEIRAERLRHRTATCTSIRRQVLMRTIS